MDTIGLENALSLEKILSDAQAKVTIVVGHVHGIHHGQLGRHPVFTAPSTCSTFALDRRKDAPIGFLNAPTGCAVIDTAGNGLWSAVAFGPADGPFPF